MAAIISRSARVAPEVTPPPTQLGTETDGFASVLPIDMVKQFMQVEVALDEVEGEGEELRGMEAPRPTAVEVTTGFLSCRGASVAEDEGVGFSPANDVQPISDNEVVAHPVWPTVWPTPFIRFLHL